jgi:hypothetical protein
MSPIVAYGVHPLNNTIVEFMDVDVLHSTIIEWYSLIEDHNLIRNLRYYHILFCINEKLECVFEGDTASYSSSHYDVESDGFVYYGNYGLMHRYECSHFEPSIDTIVIPQVMFDMYIDRYSRIINYDIHD